MGCRAGFSDGAGTRLATGRGARECLAVSQREQEARGGSCAVAVTPAAVSLRLYCRTASKGRMVKHTDLYKTQYHRIYKSSP